VRSSERGAASILGILLSLAIALVLAYMLLQSQGLIGRSSESEGPDPMDQARIAAAMVELRSVKSGLALYARLKGPSYPATAEINSLDDLREILAGSIPLQADPAFTFMSYTSAHADTFVLVVRALDDGRTPLFVTPMAGPARR
jgi:hypothetical protein